MSMHSQRPPDVGEHIRTPEHGRAGDHGPVECAAVLLGRRQGYGTAERAALGGWDGVAPAVHHDEIVTQVVIHQQTHGWLSSMVGAPVCVSPHLFSKAMCAGPQQSSLRLPR